MRVLQSLSVTGLLLIAVPTLAQQPEGESPYLQVMPAQTAQDILNSARVKAAEAAPAAASESESVAIRSAAPAAAAAVAPSELTIAPPIRPPFPGFNEVKLTGKVTVHRVVCIRAPCNFPPTVMVGNTQVTGRWANELADGFEGEVVTISGTSIPWWRPPPRPRPVPEPPIFEPFAEGELESAAPSEDSIFIPRPVPGDPVNVTPIDPTDPIVIDPIFPPPPRIRVVNVDAFYPGKTKSDFITGTVQLTKTEKRQYYPQGFSTAVTLPVTVLQTTEGNFEINDYYTAKQLEPFEGQPVTITGTKQGGPFHILIFPPPNREFVPDYNTDIVVKGPVYSNASQKALKAVLSQLAGDNVTLKPGLDFPDYKIVTPQRSSEYLHSTNGSLPDSDGESRWATLGVPRFFEGSTNIQLKALSDPVSPEQVIPFPFDPIPLNEMEPLSHNVGANPERAEATGPTVVLEATSGTADQEALNRSGK